MGKTHNEFIELYKKIETATKKVPGAPADADFRWLITYFENDKELASVLTQKMYLCKMLRNYISHNDDYESIIEISPGLMKFLQDLYSYTISTYSTYSDMMISITKAKTLNDTDTLISAFSFLNKNHFDYDQNIFVIDKKNNIIGVTSFENITAAIIDNDSLSIKLNKTKAISKLSKKNVVFVSKSDVYEKNDVLTIVADNGKSTGNVIGVVL